MIPKGPRLAWCLLFFLLYACSSPPSSISSDRAGGAPSLEVFFSPRGERYTSATFVANAGIPTFIDAKHAIAHNKIMIIDGATLITGSFNFTKAAEEKNAENLLVIKGDPGLVKKYLANFEEHLGHSEKYEGRH